MSKAEENEAKKERDDSFQLFKEHIHECRKQMHFRWVANGIPFWKCRNPWEKLPSRAKVTL